MFESAESKFTNDATSESTGASGATGAHDGPSRSATPISDGLDGMDDVDGDATMASTDRRWITFTLPGEVGADFASVVGG